MGTDFSKQPNQDFVGFSFGKWHCIRDGHVYRTSDGSRYNTNLLPTLTDKTADVPGADGQYYFDTFYKNRSFSISIAFDELSEEDYHNLRKVFNGKEIKDLIFDELPYKAYSAKITGTPSIKALCFDREDGQRVYKGEGTLQFTCYYPFAHTPTWVWYKKEDGTITHKDADGRLLSNYSKEVYDSRDQWAAVSGLNEYTTVNNGELSAPFIIRYTGSLAEGTTINACGLKIVLPEGQPDAGATFVWDSKSGLVYIESDGKKTAIQYTGQSYGSAEPGDGMTANIGTVDYQYWYY